APTHSSPLSLHDALPISRPPATGPAPSPRACAPGAWHPGGPSSACADCRCRRCAPSELDPASPPPPTRSSQSDRWSRPPGRSGLPEEVGSASRASSPACCACSATCSVSHLGVGLPKCMADCEHRRQSLSSFCLLEEFPFFLQ